MFHVEKLTKDLCINLKVSAALALNGNNSCEINEIKDSCFASESCMYGFTSSGLDALLHCDLSYIVTCDRKNKFCACVGANLCRQSVPYFPHIVADKNALFVHTLCVESNYRKHGLATDLLDRLKEKNVTLYLTVATGKLGQRNELIDFFDKRSSKLCRFYKKQGFKEINHVPKYILFKFSNSNLEE